MYLLIGHDSDTLSRRVEAALRGCGHTVVLTPVPLAGEGWVTWSLDTRHSESRLRCPSGCDVTSTELRGVLVRALGGPVTADGWAPPDFSYVQAETQAALLAWLWSLPCRVVNRMTADLWFRPQRPYLEWHTLVGRCGLPTLAVQITNDLSAARAFADRWSGTVTYAPLTSSTRYSVVDDYQWAELGKVMTLLPACLVEPCTGPALYACLVGRDVIWDGDIDPCGGERAAFEGGLRRLAAELRVDLLQIEVRRGRAGLCCTGVDLYPNLDPYDAPGQELLVAGLVNVLGGGR